MRPPAAPKWSTTRASSTPRAPWNRSISVAAALRRPNPFATAATALSASKPKRRRDKTQYSITPPGEESGCWRSDGVVEKKERYHIDELILRRTHARESCHCHRRSQRYRSPCRAPARAGRRQGGR